MLNLSQKNRILNLALILFGIVLGFEILFYHSAIVNALSYFVTTVGAFGWVAICILQYVQVAFIPIPAYFITLTSMKMYPNQLILLFILTLLMVMLGSLTAYLIGKKWGKKAVIKVAGSEEEYSKWLKVFKSKKANIIYLATVLFPIFPDDILCILAGSINMNFWWFLFCNFIGRAIGLVTFMFVFTAMGSGLTNIIVFGGLLLLCIILKIIVKRKMKNELDIDR